MATTYIDTAMGARAIGARTDAAASPAIDVSAEEDRFAQNFLTPGWVKPSNSFEPVAGAGATMNVIIGSGSAKTDYYAIEGVNAGQGVYLVRLAATSVTVTLNAADGSFARRDEIYLLVSDTAYDGSGVALPRIGYRDGTPSASPAAPGPDVAWDAYVLLATIDVPQSAADILACTITDERISSSLEVGNTFTSVVPGAIQPDASAAEGVSESLARADHRHSNVTEAANTIVPDASPGEGAATSFSRSDHTHGIAAAAPSTTHTLSTSNAEGASSSFARADHTHAHDPADTADIANVGTANAQGSNAEFARGDHVHGLPNMAAIGVVTGTVSSLGGGTLSTSMVAKASATFTMPSGWNTARILAFGNGVGDTFDGPTVLNGAIKIGSTAISSSRSGGYGDSTNARPAVTVYHTADVSATSSVQMLLAVPFGGGSLWWEAQIAFIAIRLT